MNVLEDQAIFSIGYVRSCLNNSIANNDLATTSAWIAINIFLFLKNGFCERKKRKKTGNFMKSILLIDLG